MGGFLGAGQLGLYAMGFRFGELTYIGVAEPITQVTFPAFSRMRERGEDWRASFQTVLRLVALVTFPIGVFFSGAAEPIVDTLLGDKWTGTIGPLAVFGVWAMLKPLEGTFGWLLNSLEQQAQLANLRALASDPVRTGADDRRRPGRDHRRRMGDGRAHGRAHDRRLAQRARRAAASRCERPAPSRRTACARSARGLGGRARHGDRARRRRAGPGARWLGLACAAAFAAAVVARGPRAYCPTRSRGLARLCEGRLPRVKRLQPSDVARVAPVHACVADSRRVTRRSGP